MFIERFINVFDCSDGSVVLVAHDFFVVKDDLREPICIIVSPVKVTTVWRCCHGARLGKVSMPLYVTSEPV